VQDKKLNQNRASARILDGAVLSYFVRLLNGTKGHASDQSSFDTVAQSQMGE